MTTPAREHQPEVAGHTEAEGFAASLLQMAIWIEESVEGSVPPSQRLDLGDVDIDELRSAAQFIAQQAARVEELTKALEKARKFIDPDLDPPRMTNCELLVVINKALATSLERSGGAT